MPIGEGDYAEVEVGQTRRKDRLACWQAAEQSCVRGWSSAANRFGDSVLAWIGEEARSERMGRAMTGLSPRGVRPVIQGTSETPWQGPLHIRAGNFSSLILA